MSTKIVGCLSRILKGCPSSSSGTKLYVATAPFLRNTQRSISTAWNTQGIFSSRSQPASPIAHLLFYHGHIKPPYLTQAATFFSKVDVSTIPKHDPEKGRLVYVGTMAKMVKFVKAFSVSTSMLGLCLQPYLYQHANDQPLALMMAIGGMLSFFVFLTPLLLHFITKRYVTQLYYDENTGMFTATTYTFFIQEKETRFAASDVMFPEVPGLFTSVTVKGMPIFLDASLFLEREAYIRLLNYDKPIKWEMPDDDDKKN